MRLNTVKVPLADTFPLLSTLKSPAKSVVEVAMKSAFERSDEVVVPSVTVTCVEKAEPAPASVPQVNLPVEALYKTVSPSAPVQPVTKPSWKNPSVTAKEVEADKVLDTVRVDPTEDEADTINPPSKYESPSVSKLPSINKSSSEATSVRPAVPPASDGALYAVPCPPPACMVPDAFKFPEVSAPTSPAKRE